MSKELPYFKFTPSEWLIGKISYQSLEIQGAFLQCCCMYWKLNGNIKPENIDFRVGKENLKHLIEYEFIKIENGLLRIEFLEEQLQNFESIREQRKIAGAKGAVANAKNKIANAQNPIANQQQSSAYIRVKSKELRDILNKSLLSEIKISDDKKFLLLNDQQIEIYETEASAFEIAEHFRTLFIKNLKDKKAPTIHQEQAKYKNYVDPIRLMLEKKECTIEQIREVYRYLNSKDGEFWKTNILSTAKLREQIDVLIAKKNTKKASNPKSYKQ